MRLFVALVPPVEAIDDLDRAVAPVRAARPELRWIPTERWHLTLAFYGEVAEGDLARTERRGLRAAVISARACCGSACKATGSGCAGWPVGSPRTAGPIGHT